MKIINRKRKRKLNLGDGFNYENLKIATFINNDNKDKLKFAKVGGTVLPAPNFGINCRKNAFGYSYPDKTKPKEYRYVYTLEYYPYGNESLDKRYCHVEKHCYQRVIVPPNGIELSLTTTKNGHRVVVANLVKKDIQEIIRAINVLVEIYGECTITDEELEFDESIKYFKQNWVMLPPGERPSTYVDRIIGLVPQKEKTRLLYHKHCLETIENLGYKEVHQGKEGFGDYKAYLFDNICVLETANYANATFIIDRNNWEEVSKLTKQELVTYNLVLARIVHNRCWEESIVDSIKMLNKEKN